MLIYLLPWFCFNQVIWFFCVNFLALRVKFAPWRYSTVPQMLSEICYAIFLILFCNSWIKFLFFPAISRFYSLLPADWFPSVETLALEQGTEASVLGGKAEYPQCVELQEKIKSGTEICSEGNSYFGSFMVEGLRVRDCCLIWKVAMNRSSNGEHCVRKWMYIDVDEERCVLCAIISLQHFLVSCPSFRYWFESTLCNTGENNVEMRFVTAPLHKQVHIDCFGGFPLLYCNLASSRVIHIRQNFFLWYTK